MITVVRQDLDKVGRLILDHLQKKFYGTFMTPANLERVKWELEAFREHHARGERNPVWYVKWEVTAELNALKLTPILDDVTLIDRPVKHTVYR